MKSTALVSSTLALLLSQTALAHPGHGASVAHLHTELIAALAIGAGLVAVYLLRRRTDDGKRGED